MGFSLPKIANIVRKEKLTESQKEKNNLAGRLASNQGQTVPAG